MASEILKGADRITCAGERRGRKAQAVFSSNIIKAPEVLALNIKSLYSDQQKHEAVSVQETTV